jgi:8-oxo-dGTP pyrophosphatase MutT (NUDIX family)
LPSPEPDDTKAQRTIVTGSGRFEERSAGALVFRRTASGPVYLLLKYPAGHWDFPKGNIEKGETPLDAMHREVREETGLVAVRPLEGFEHLIEYYYSRDGKKIHKQVTFFLAESQEDKVTLSFEHQEYTWLGFRDAIKVVSYSNSKKLLRAAEERFRARGSRD